MERVHPRGCGCKQALLPGPVSWALYCKELLLTFSQGSVSIATLVHMFVHRIAVRRPSAQSSLGSVILDGLPVELSLPAKAVLWGSLNAARLLSYGDTHLESSR